jgi:hypothetical protein
MAAPESITMKDISGKYVMNKKLSGDFEGVLVLQGIGWATRKAIGYATVTLIIKHKPGPPEEIDIEQILTGGLKGSPEHRVLDNEFRGHSDTIFGEVSGRSRRRKFTDYNDEDEDDKFLKSGWAQDTLDAGELIESHVESPKGWKATQAWGFEVVDGARRYARHVVVWNAKDKKRIKLFYDYAEA